MSPNTSRRDDAEQHHPTTAPLTHLPAGSTRSRQARVPGEGFYLISKTSWRLSSYFFFHSFASISFVMI